MIPLIKLKLSENRGHLYLKSLLYLQELVATSTVVQDITRFSHFSERGYQAYREHCLCVISSAVVHQLQSPVVVSSKVIFFKWHIKINI